MTTVAQREPQKPWQMNSTLWSPTAMAGEGNYAELVYLVAEGHDLERQFKPPSLRNVADRGPFMHKG